MHKVLTAFVVGVTFGLVGCAEPEPASGSNAGTNGTVGNTAGTTTQPLMPFRPVIGGHLLVTADASKILMADVESDRLRVFSTSQNALAYDVALPEKSWPTRIIEGRDGAIHVLLRGTGEVATVRGQAVTLTAVCPEPRALALGEEENQLVVGCAGGELVRINGATVLITKTGVEWRDLTVTSAGVSGTSFRSAELVTLANGQSLGSRLKTPPQQLNPLNGTAALHQAQVVWRMVPSGSRTLLIHQLHANELTINGTSTNPLPNTSTSPYGGGAAVPGQMVGCNSSAVVSAVSTVQGDQVVAVQRINDVLPVDAALSPDGSQLAVVSAGGTGLSIYPVNAFNSTSSCAMPTAGFTGFALNSVAWVSPTKVVVVESLRASPLIFDLATANMTELGDKADRGSTAHTLFHVAPRGGAPLACASCHPEGGEDGHTWVIDGKKRRTQTLSGGVMKRAPFHWEGELAGLDNLMSDTFVKRMGGSPAILSEVATLGAWLDTLPAPKASRQLTADQRTAGLAAFQKAQCSNCHLAGGLQEGPASDIGTGESVRAPSLAGLSARAPYLHTGEIADIRSRVTGTLHPAHGNLRSLNSAEQEELIGFLESL
jgi:mono/diheme cytochrome c family protein